jgi:hypothetical protein
MPPGGQTKLSHPVVEPAGICGLPQGQVTMPPMPGAQNRTNPPSGGPQVLEENSLR